MKLDGYIRVSRVGKREGPSFISPDVQRQRIEGLVAAGGHEIGEWITDLDESGAKADRPGFVEALQRVESGGSQGIAVMKLDRFARSVADCADAVRRIEAAGGVLLSAHESIDTSGAFGRFVLNVMSAMAELELERLRESWETARASAVARGVHVSSRVPTGYRRDEEKRLVPVDGVPIAKVFRAKAEGASWRELGRILEDAGVRTPYGSERWQPGSLRKLLQNRVYLGEARSGEFVLRDAHPALVSEAVWQAAQFTGVKSVNAFGGALLSGLIRCAGCGYVMKADTMRDRKGEKRRLYRCRDHATGECTGRASILGSVVEPFVVDAFFEFFPDLQLRGREASADLTAAEERVAEARAELVVYRELSIVELGADVWSEGMRTRAVALQEAEAALRRLVVDAPATPPGELRGIWPDLTVEEQREVLSGSMDVVFVRSTGQRNTPVDERVAVLWRGEGPADLPGPGRRSGIRPYEWA